MASALRHAGCRCRDVDVVAVSSLYRTPPWGKLDQPDFLNAAAELSTGAVAARSCSTFAWKPSAS